MTSILPRSHRVLHATLVSVTVVLATPAAAQELLPAMMFRPIAGMAGENWPADFNGDGITDLVGIAGGSGAVQVVLGNGDGTFRPPIVSSTIGAPRSTGDVDRDGAVDVIAQVGDVVVVVPGNRTGALGAPRRVLGGEAEFVVVADLNGDGHRDIVVGEQGHQLYIAPGRGDFTFDPVLTLTTGAWPHGVAIADLNHDTRPDIVVAHNYEWKLIVFRNDGGFIFTPIDIPVHGPTTDVVARDMTGDDELDLVVSARPRGDGPFEGGSVLLFPGNGDATFRAPTQVATGIGAQSIVLGDFTHDGRIDIATSNHSWSYRDYMCGPNIIGEDSVSILPGRTDGTFGPAHHFSVDPFHRLPEPPIGLVRSLNTSDVNRDGFSDLIAGLGTVMVTAEPRANRAPTVSAGQDYPGPATEALNIHGSATDPDGHYLNYQWSDHGAGGDFNVFEEGGVRGWPENCYYPGDYGTFQITLTADDGHGGTASDSASVSFPRPNEIPSVVIDNPQSGEVLTLGVPYTIRWRASDFDGIRDVDIDFSADEGRTWSPIAECTNLAGSATSCTWNSPGPVTEGGRFLITATDNTGLTGANSSAPFRIVRPGSGGNLPSGWTLGDVGAAGAAGSSDYIDGVFTVRGSGADVWGTADEFHWAYTAMSGDFDFTARVRNVQNVSQWTKAGLMIRGTTNANSVHASLFATPTITKGIAFQRRRANGGTSVHTAGPALTPAIWLRVSRRGASIIASYRRTITDPWTLIARDDIANLGSSVLVGLAVSSHVDGTVASASFDNMTLDRAASFTSRDIGAVGPAGSSDSNGVRTLVAGSGADIWGTTDAFRSHFTTMTGDGTITARVLSLDNTHAWAKAGIMLRESLDPGSRHLMVIVSAAKGVAMQSRFTTSGTSDSSTPVTGRAPIWLRMTRAGTRFTAEISTNGVTWTEVNTSATTMPDTLYVGLAVTSHDNTRRAAAAFDDVSIRR